jgi:predicted Zn-ribbon and HTH transcriptional regulator
MTSWYSSIQSKIPTSAIPPNIISPIEIQNSIEDLGEFTIFCEEYKVGVDYRVANGYGATANTKSGTVVSNSDNVMQLKDKKMGYKFNSTYMENEFDESSWDSLISGNTSYLYDINENISKSGYTSSKLKFIHLDNYLTDDVGNIIEGIYDVSGHTNHQPAEGTVLEPLYQIGVISNVTNVDGHDDMFKGDVINSMTFYYKTVDGEIGSSAVTISDSSVSIKDTISGITKDSNKICDDDIYCDVNYNVGNIYTLNSNNELSLTSSGVSYTETVQFEKSRVEYYLKQRLKGSSPSDARKVDTHSISYPIYVYRLKQKEELIDDNPYRVTYADNLSRIDYTLRNENGKYIRKSAYKFVCKDCGFKSKEDINSSTCPNCGSEKWVGGDILLPIVKEEYRVGVSAPENIKGNIYIDRGINSAFEKHLKLGEVASLEALENYGNNYFKIMDV